MLVMFGYVTLLLVCLSLVRFSAFRYVSLLIIRIG